MKEKQGFGMDWHPVSLSLGDMVLLQNMNTWLSVVDCGQTSKQSLPRLEGLQTDVLYVTRRVVGF